MKATSIYTPFFCLLCLLAACTSPNERTDHLEMQERKPTKVEQFRLQPTDSIYDLCDLSNDSISEFPDLSAYTIRKLDLSYNQIEKINTHYFPKGIQNLNLSHNHLRHILQFRGITDSSIIDLKELNVSHNRLSGINILMPIKLIGLKRIDASHNDIVHLKFLINLNYLDISYNSNLNKIVRFDPEIVDTLLHEGVANGEPLVYVVALSVQKLMEEYKRGIRKRQKDRREIGK